MNNTPPNQSNVVISVKNLYKSFGDNHVLKGVDLELHKSENIIVLGKSGSGKSVLIKIISGLLTQDSGSVEVLGKDVSTLPKKELQKLRLKVGFSFQSSALYDSMTVEENLRFPLVRNAKDLSRNEINNAVEEVLDAVGLSQTLKQMPAE
jgi:phospholipid/cholesterol/gamma-HCH transport system ATP-binding protein